jgi:hypothetical protein
MRGHFLMVLVFLFKTSEVALLSLVRAIVVRVRQTEPFDSIGGMRGIFKVGGLVDNTVATEAKKSVETEPAVIDGLANISGKLGSRCRHDSPSERGG